MSINQQPYWIKGRTIWMNNDQVSRGNHLRQCRQEKNMTLRELSEKTGISVGFLSKIEKGIGNPSAGNIQKICYALDITANELMAPKANEEQLSTIHEGSSYVQRSSERCLLYDFANSIRFESIYEGNPHFKLNVMTLTGGSEHPVTTVHSYDEYGIVAKGTMAMELEGFGRVELKEGDSIMVRARTPHSAHSISSEDCISYWLELTDTNRSPL